MFNDWDIGKGFGMLWKAQKKGVKLSLFSFFTNPYKNFHMANKEKTKPQKLTDKEMRKLLLNLKEKAEKSPIEEDSFSLEVICSKKDIDQSSSFQKK